MAYQQCLALHHHFHLAQIVANQRGATAHNIEDGIGQTYARTYLHTAGDNVHLGIQMVVGQEFPQYHRVARGNGLPVKPLQTLIVGILGNSQRQSATAETQSRYDFGLGTTLHIFVLAHNTNVGNARCHTLRNVIVAQI